MNLETVFTALLAWIVFKENVDRRIALGMISIVCGGLIISSTGTARLTGWIGPVSIAGACLCWGIDNNVTQKVSGRDPVQIAALKGLSAGAVNAVLATSLGSQRPDWQSIGAALLLGFVSYGVSLVLYIRALRKLGTARTGNYFSLAPFIGAVVSVALWREPVTLPLLAAGVFMAGEVVREHVAEGADVLERRPSHHDRLEHSHPHYPDVHHRHNHKDKQ